MTNQVEKSNDTGSERSIAYFSMEIALEAGMPTYSGGLGVLAGDTIRSAADLKVPMVAVTLIHRKGYFYQRLDSSGWQTEEPVEWSVDDFLKEMPQRVSVTLESRRVLIRCWRYEVIGIGGFGVPVYLLDTDLPENSEWDRTLTHYLYGGNQRYRLCQEVVLGMGGVRMLRALGYESIKKFHMNEGHSSLLVLELLDEEARKEGRSSILYSDVEVVRSKCVFTTHTPVPAGHDQFPLDLVNRVLGRREVYDMKDVFCCENLLNMTFLGFNLSHYINGVAKRHGEITKSIFAHYQIDAITNGVHASTWVSGPFAELFDRYIPGWKEDNSTLRSALSIPKPEVWDAHVDAKKWLIQYVNRQTNAGMDLDVFTIGFARRATAYKRGDLLFTDIERLKAISSKSGTLQVIYAGKAHPQDQGGKQVIKRIFDAKRALQGVIKIAYLENYDIELAKMIVSGVDVWLNTPKPPLEASGTSGMKAALNGVPSLSVLDGWWIEGHIEGITGWSIGEDSKTGDGSNNHQKDAELLYDKLEQEVIPLFYRDRDRFIDVMRHAVALNGSYFNTQRMLQQYVVNAYFR
ncbi:MAG TPA: alpha-glucan family phosphorylase [Thermodesulfobacteriota bacterium]|nr:alpha-glucan family phosphorylase [Thermodesulfobacteriota bacterium]